MNADERDLAAWNAFGAAGKFHVPTVESVPELDVEQAVFEALAILLRTVRGRVEHKGDDQAFDERALVRVYTEMPIASDTAAYPAAYIESTSSADLDASVEKPVERMGFDGIEDVITDEWALWRRGTDTGEANVKIFTNSEPEATALATAVREAIAGDLDRWRGAVLPLSVRYLPPPFRDAFEPAQTPSTHIVPADSRGRPALDSESGVWTVDVEFTWTATRFAARPRLADFRPFVTVTTEP